MKTLIFSHLYHRPGVQAASQSWEDLLGLWLNHLRGPGRYTGDVMLFSNIPGIERSGVLVRPLPDMPADIRRAHMIRVLSYDRVPVREYDVALQMDLDVLAVDDVNVLFPQDDRLWAAPSDLRTLDWTHAWTLLPKWRRAAHKLTGWRMREPGVCACAVGSATAVWERNFGSWARVIRGHGDRPPPHYGDQSFLNLLFLTHTVPMACWSRSLIVHKDWETRLVGARLLHFPGARKQHMARFRMV